jgi:hypothetical protein
MNNVKYENENQIYCDERVQLYANECASWYNVPHALVSGVTLHNNR